MKKYFYYFRIILFILYLIFLILLIDKILTVNILGSIFFILSLIYSVLIILSILSKKKVFKETISYNLINIGLYTYIILIYYITFSSTKLDILSNDIYFRNNFIVLILLTILLMGFTLLLNNDKIDKSDII